MRSSLYLLILCLALAVCRDAAFAADRVALVVANAAYRDLPLQLRRKAVGRFVEAGVRFFPFEQGGELFAKGIGHAAIVVRLKWICAIHP